MICDICQEEVAATYQNEFCGENDTYGHLECVQEIQKYLEETHKGKSGIYPMLVTQEIAAKWQIGIAIAGEHVQEYIRKEVRKLC